MAQSTQSEWIERFARFGYAAKGFVYALVGVLALQAALTRGGKITDPKGVLYEIFQQPFGQILLSLVTIGLLGYAMWRFLQAFKDVDNKGSSAKGLLERFSFAISGVIYCGFAFTAIKLLSGAEQGGGKPSDQSTQHWTARFLSQPFGEWLVGLGGVIFVGSGFYYFYKAFTGKFRQELNMRNMSRQEEKWVMLAGRLGLSARGVIFVMIGWFLMKAAYQSDADEAHAIPGTLEVLLKQPYGVVLLGVMAVGLLIYGLYMGVQARYRRITPPKNSAQEIFNMGK